MNAMCKFMWHFCTENTNVTSRRGKARSEVPQIRQLRRRNAQARRAICRPNGSLIVTTPREERRIEQVSTTQDFLKISPCPWNPLVLISVSALAKHDEVRGCSRILKYQRFAYFPDRARNAGGHGTNDSETKRTSKLRCAEMHRNLGQVGTGTVGFAFTAVPRHVRVMEAKHSFAERTGVSCRKSGVFNGPAYRRGIKVGVTAEESIASARTNRNFLETVLAYICCPPFG